MRVYQRVWDAQKGVANWGRIVRIVNTSERLWPEGTRRKGVSIDKEEAHTPRGREKKERDRDIRPKLRKMTGDKRWGIRAEGKKHRPGQTPTPITKKKRLCVTLRIGILSGEKRSIRKDSRSTTKWTCTHTLAGVKAWQKGSTWEGKASWIVRTERRSVPYRNPGEKGAILEKRSRRKRELP